MNLKKFFHFKSSNDSDENLNLSPIELSLNVGALVPGIKSEVDCLSVGVLWDMFKREVTILESELQSYISGTLEAIERTRTSKGEIVGLPIDNMNHNREESCGRIINVKLGKGPIGNSIIIAEVLWNDVGLDLIKSNKVRGFSATVNIRDRIILGGSLTNWPATVDQTGKLLLRPVELSQSSNGDNGMTPEEIEQIIKTRLEEMVAPTVTAQMQTSFANLGLGNKSNNESSESSGNKDTAVQPNIFELFDSAEALEEVQNEMRRQFAAQYQTIRDSMAQQSAVLIAQMNHENRVRDFCANIGSGTGYNFSLPVELELVTKFTASLNHQQFKMFSSIVDEVLQNGLIDLRELGSGSTSENNVGTQKLPKEIAESLKQGIIKVSDLSSPILNLGDLSVYDLSEFSK